MVGEKLLMLLFFLVLSSSISFGAVIEDKWDVSRDDTDEETDEEMDEEMDELRSHSQFANFREDYDDNKSTEQMVNIPAQDRIEDEEVYDNDDEEEDELGDDVMNEEENDNLQDDAKLYSNEVDTPSSIFEDAGRTSNELDEDSNFEDFKRKVAEIRKTNEDMQAQINRLHRDFDVILGHSEDLSEHPEEAKNDVRQHLSSLDHSHDHVSNENKGNWQDTGMPRRSVIEDELARTYSRIGEDDYAPDSDY